jgi:NitT/TauT family transport system permease protein
MSEPRMPAGTAVTSASPPLEYEVPVSTATVDAGAVPRRKRIRRVPAWEALQSIVTVLAVLEICGRTGAISQQSFPLVSEVLQRLFQDAMTSVFWERVGQTMAQAAVGLAVGTALAVPTGILLGRVHLLDDALRPIVEFLRPIPSVAILPLVILTVGIGFAGAVLLSAISCFWLVLVLTIRGARAVDPVASQAMTAFRLPRAAQIRHLVLPSATPFITTGIRIAGAVSLIVVITAELLGGMPGLGKAVQASLQSADRTGMYSYTVAAGLLGLLVNSVLLRVEDRVLSWHPSRRNRSNG